MIGWLVNWWRQRRFQKQRLLFWYYDGQNVRRGDPYKIWRDLQHNQKVDFPALLKTLDETPEKEPETSQLIALIAEAFDIKRLDAKTGTGLTDWEVLGLFGELDNYMTFLKKKFSPGPTSPQPTA